MKFVDFILNEEYLHSLGIETRDINNELLNDEIIFKNMQYIYNLLDTNNSKTIFALKSIKYPSYKELMYCLGNNRGGVL